MDRIVVIVRFDLVYGQQISQKNSNLVTKNSVNGHSYDQKPYQCITGYYVTRTIGTISSSA